MSWQKLGRRIREDLWERPQPNFDHLDGLRGVASLIVLFAHCGLYMGIMHNRVGPEAEKFDFLEHVFSVTWCGIDIFFVLSGFLVGRILLISITRDRSIHWRRFILRRTFRIFPAYYFVLTLSLFVIAPIGGKLWPILYGTTEWSELFANSWGNYLYLSNYTHAGHVANPLAWGWSLAVEEQFYLFLPPLLLYLLRARSATTHIVVLVLCVVVPLAGRWVQYQLDPNIVILEGFYHATHNRVDAPMLGVLIAYIYVRYPEKLEAFVVRAGPTLWIAALFCFGSVSAWGGLYGQGEFNVVWQFSMTAWGTALLLLDGLYRKSLAYRFLAHHWWYPLSRTSYGAYLIHSFIMFGWLEYYLAANGRVVMSVPGFFVYYVCIVISVTVAAGTMFMVLERPVLDYGVKVNRKLDERAASRTGEREA